MDKKIWVPPKAKPTLPFGLGPPAEPIKAEDYEASTYKAHEIKLLQESGQSIVMSLAISLFMSFKFQVHVSLLMQSVMLPMNTLDSIVLKKYILGIKKENMYSELFAAPTEASLAAVAAANQIAADEPRVVELPPLEKDKDDHIKTAKEIIADKIIAEDTTPKKDK